MKDPNLDLLNSILALEKELSDSDKLDMYRDVYPGLYKSVVVGIGSYFEVRMMNVIEECAVLNSSSPWIVDLIRGKALKRQYHTLFSWEDLKVSPLLAAFGADFKNRYKEAMRDPAMANVERRFLELGSERNLIAHTYWTVNPSKTALELKVAYEEALAYPSFVHGLLIGIDFAYVEVERFAD